MYFLLLLPRLAHTAAAAEEGSVTGARFTGSVAAAAAVHGTQEHDMLLLLSLKQRQRRLSIFYPTAIPGSGRRYASTTLAINFMSRLPL